MSEVRLGLPVAGTLVSVNLLGSVAAESLVATVTSIRVLC